MFNETFEKKSTQKRVLFVGIPDMAYICLDGLNRAGVNIVGVIGPKKDHQTYSHFKQFTKHLKLNFIEFDELDDENFIQKVKDLNADIAVVCSFNYKIPKVLLDSVKDGFINVHPSLLPKYRGPNPYSVVISENEKETGVTLHFMDETFDTGDIISQKTIQIMGLETMGTLFNRLNVLALEMLIETLKDHQNDNLTAKKQPAGEFKKGENFSEDQLFLDFSKAAKEIECFIRALNPFILARSYFRDTIVKVLSAETSNEESPSSQPLGTIVKIENDKFYISTSEGLLAPTSMQFGSFFAGTSKEFIRILNPRIGERFL